MDGWVAQQTMHAKRAQLARRQWIQHGAACQLRGHLPVKQAGVTGPQPSV